MSRKSKRAKGKLHHPQARSAPTSMADIDKLVAQRDFKQAIRLLRVQISRHPSDEGRRLLAECCFATHAYPEGQSTLEHIAAKTATDIALLGWAHLHQEHWDRAVQRFEEALALGPHPATYYFLARSRAKDQPDYHLDQATREAVRDLLAQAIVLPNCLEEAFLWFEELQGYAAEGITERHRILENALAQHPNSAEVRLRLASLFLHRLQDPPAALRVLEPVLMHHSPPVRALWYAVEAHIALGEHEAALATADSIPTDAHTEGVGLAKVQGDLLYHLRLSCWGIVSGPPVIVSGELDRGDEGRIGLQGQAAVELQRIERVQVGGTGVDERCVGEGSQPLGGLQLRRVGRQGQQMQVLGDDEAPAQVPGRPIEEQQDQLGRAGPDLRREVLQRTAEELDVDAGGECHWVRPEAGWTKPER